MEGCDASLKKRKPLISGRDKHVSRESVCGCDSSAMNKTSKR